jgi:hypothetical protein
MQHSQLDHVIEGVAKKARKLTRGTHTHTHTDTDCNMTYSSSSALPRARLRPLQQPPLDVVSVYDTATHCYLLATDSLQRDYHLLTCRKHSREEASASFASGVPNNNTASESDADDRGGFSSTGSPSRPPYAAFCSLEDLHDYTSYAVYSPTEAASLIEALRREHGTSMYIWNAVALVGAVRFTEGYYLVIVTERRTAGYLGVHRLFEATQVELVSLLLDNDWIAAQLQTRRGGGLDGASSASHSNRGPIPHRHPQQPSSYRKNSSSATAAAAAYLFQRRSLEELYRQQFLSSLSRPSSFFYSHSYDLTNTLQRNTLADGAAAQAQAQAQEKPEVPLSSHDHLHQPRMQYLWNEYLLEPWQLPEERTARATNYDSPEHSLSNDDAGVTDQREPSPTTSTTTTLVPCYPSAFARWRITLIHGYVTQRTVVVRRPTFHTLLLTLIARVSKASAGVRYLRRGVSSDGQVANHVEVEQIVIDESAWNQGFTDGALSSYVQLRGSVPLRWYHPPTASRLLPKPPIVIGPTDAEWSSTCLHFQDLLRQYGGPILAHDLLKRKEHHTRESALGDAYRAATQALTAAVARGEVGAGSIVHDLSEASASGAHTFAEPLRSADVLQYESTDLRSLGPLAWNTMTAIAERHFDQVHCFVCRRVQQSQLPRSRSPHDVSLSPSTPLPPRDYTVSSDACPSVAVQIQCGVVRSNCLDCIDRTNLGQLFHGLHALGEQLTGLGLLHHAAELRDSPAVSELLLEMFLAMGDALATQYGGSAQVGAGVLHRGAGWDQLMGVKRLYNNVMGDRDKQEAIKLLLGRTQPHPRRYSRARNTTMHSPGQVLPFALSTSLLGSSSLNASITTATSGVTEAAAAAAVAGASPSNRSHIPVTSGGNTEKALVPAAPSSSSLVSNVLRAASRWWGEVTGASTASSTTDAAATAAEALRAAQHAAAEAEAEPDYYEHVFAGPRLAPAGLLATWWVQPLREFATWYAACGVDVLRGHGATTHGEPSSGDGATKDPSGCHDDASPPPTPSFPPPSVKSLVRPSTMTMTAMPQPSPAAVLEDAFAQHLLAADSVAQQQWLLFVTRWERQACLQSPGQRSGGEGGGGPPTVMTPAAASAGGAVVFGVGSSSSSVGVFNGTAEGSLVRPFLSAWGVDGIGSVETASLPGDERMLTDESVAAAAASVYGRGAAAVATPLFAPFSLTLTPSLFTEGWVVLHTTAHILPIDAGAPTTTAAAAGESCNSRSTSAVPNDLAASASLGLLYAWRNTTTAGQGMLDAPSSVVGRSSIQGKSTCGPADTSVVLTVVRQLFGCLPPNVAVTAENPFATSASHHHPSWDQQMWRCPEDPHNHATFPRAVQTSVFARQEKQLEQLVCREAMTIAERGHGVRQEVTTTTTVPPLSAKNSARRGEEAVRLVEDRRSFTGRGVVPPRRLNTHQQTTGTLHSAVEDQQFVAALLQEQLGTADRWEADEIIVALQQLLYPAPLSPAVQLLLRHSVVQPPLRGAELLDVKPAQGIVDAKDDVREYWQRRLAQAAAAAADEGVGIKGDASPLLNAAQKPKDTKLKSASATCDAAVALLCRLSTILCSAASFSTRGPAAVVLGSHIARGVTTAGHTTTLRQLESSVDRDVCRPYLSSTAQGEEEKAFVAAVAPLLQIDGDDVPAAVRYELLSPDHPALPEPMRRCWLLCRLLQPLFSCVLSPSLLHGMLLRLFSEVPATLTDCACVVSPADPPVPHRTRHRVRYTFAFSPQSHAQQREQQQLRSQLAAGVLTGPSGCGSREGADTNVVGREGEERPPPPRLRTGTLSPSPPPSSIAAAASAAVGPANPSATSTGHVMYIPATLEVKCCCTALELHRWCTQYRLRCHRAHVKEELPHFTHVAGLKKADGVATPLQSLQTHLHMSSPIDAATDNDTAEASWRLLWWAVENSLVVPVVRRREQTTLEILADETAVFCVVKDIPHVALNVERQGRGEVWRCPQPPPPTPPRRQKSDNDHNDFSPSSSCDGGCTSTIYGVHFATSLPVHRLTRRSALTDMVTLSETMASLALTAATRLQEFFRDYVQHGWTRSGLTMSGTTGVASSASAGAATVALFGGVAGGVAAAAFEGGTAGGTSEPTSSSSTAPPGAATAAVTSADASVPVSPVDVIAHFTQLAEECLQSIQSVMMALQFMSLDALADAHALHSHISFFVNVYNAAYVVAWLTNVKELVSTAAATARKTKAVTAAAASFPAARSAHLLSAGCTSHLRSIDLLSLPTLCNTNIACFMHVYGVVIGHVYLSLEEMKYGILGGNRAPPYRDTPPWSSSVDNTTGVMTTTNRRRTTATTSALSSSSPQQGQQLQTPTNARTSAHLHDEANSAWRWQSLVPLHLRVEMPEAARLRALRQHPHLQSALDWREMYDAYAPPVEASSTLHPATESHSARWRSAPLSRSFPFAGAPSASSRDALPSSSARPILPPWPTTSATNHLQPSPSNVATAGAATAAVVPPTPTPTPTARAASPLNTTTTPLSPTTPAFETQRQRYRQLVDVWSTDVVRHLSFRISLQLIDTYLPPPLLHLCHATDASGKNDGAGGALGDSGARSTPLDTHMRLDVDAERVPWYLQPILNTMPLIAPALQSSKLGVVYGVAREDDGRASGALVPQVSADANGVLLQPCRMWGSPPHYMVGGDGVNSEAAVAHSFQVLQSLSGSYIGVHGYRTGTRNRGTGHSSTGVMQHLCAPLHHEEVLAQLHATEATFRSALQSTDPQVFLETQQQQPPQLQCREKRSSSPRPDSPLFPPSWPPLGLTNATSCSAALNNMMKPLLYEWCRSTDQGMESISLLAKPGSQLRVLLKVVRLLEESYTSAEAVRQSQLAAREAV